MKSINYTTHINPSCPFSAQNLAATYLKSKTPLRLNVTESNFEEVAEAIYDLCHLAGYESRGGKGRAGGGREDIRVALSIAADMAIDADFFAENARNFKNTMSKKLQTAFNNDDVDRLVYIMCGLERNAATAIVDHRDSELVEVIENFYEIEIEDEEVEKELEMEMVDVLIMSPSTVQRRKFGGNTHKPRRKPAPQASKQLEMEF
jgi:hypothetical protein